MRVSTFFVEMSGIIAIIVSNNIAFGLFFALMCILELFVPSILLQLILLICSTVFSISSLGENETSVYCAYVHCACGVYCACNRQIREFGDKNRSLILSEDLFF